MVTLLGEGDSHTLLALVGTAGRAMWGGSNPAPSCALSYRRTSFDCLVKTSQTHMNTLDFLPQVLA